MPMAFSFKVNTPVPSEGLGDGPRHILASLLLNPNSTAVKQHPERFHLWNLQLQNLLSDRPQGPIILLATSLQKPHHLMS